MDTSERRMSLRSGLPPLTAQFYNKKYTTLTDAQRARIEANRAAAMARRQELYESRRQIIPYTPAMRPGGWKRLTPTALIKEKKVIDINPATYNFRPATTPPVPQLLNGCIAGSQN